MESGKRNRGELSRQILASVSPQERARVYKQMALAVRIADALTAKGWSKSEFAARMNQQPSVVTRWLSGTQNFTIDTLSDIEEALGVQLLVVDSVYPAGHPLAGQPTENPYAFKAAPSKVQMKEHHFAAFFPASEPVQAHCNHMSVGISDSFQTTLFVPQTISLN